MDKAKEEFLKKLLLAFKAEGEERLKSMSSELLELENTSIPEKQTEIIETIFRQVHSLKGAARAVKITNVEIICQTLENVLAALKNKERTLSSELFDIFYDTIDIINKLLSSPEESNSIQISELLEKLTSLEPAKHKNKTPSKDHLRDNSKTTLLKPPPEHPSKENKPEKREPQISAATKLKITKPVIQDDQLIKKKSVLAKSVRLATAKLDTLFLQAEQMLALKSMISQRIIELRNAKEILDLYKKQGGETYQQISKIKQLPPEIKKESNIQVQVSNPSTKLTILPRWNHTPLKLLQNKLMALVKSSEQDYRLTSAMIDNHLEDMKKILMLPFSSLLEIFPRMVRDLSREQNKQVRLVLQGSEVEIDKRILEEIKDPLIHLVRNCIDHGIEHSKERIKKGKPEHATVTISVSHVTGNKVEIIIQDDGSGIDASKVKKAALKGGIISEKEANQLSEEEIIRLIFRSAISTSSSITDISGRGLGMAIVHEKIEKLGGSISIKTKPNIGTFFHIVLPLTLATFRGILVQSAKQIFIMPTIYVERALKLSRQEIKTIEGKQMISLNGRILSLVYLDDVLELAKKEHRNSPFALVLVVKLGEKRIAFSVDKILSEQEILVKNLGKHLLHVRNIAGVTVLGSGDLAPILDIFDLMKSVLKINPNSVTENQLKEEKKSILIVDDSTTSRMFLKKILESAGYLVKTAINGVDALSRLKMENFDLVISDVQMPQMNGFDLATRIRDDKKLVKLPIILITSLTSLKDRKQGINAGANAYIAKNNLKEGNLLKVIQKLL